MNKVFLAIVLSIAFVSCIKKDALKYDPNLEGTWVSSEGGTYTWLIVKSDGTGIFASTETGESDTRGEVKYSLFEKKMWIGSRKFKVVSWWTGKYEGPSHVKTKDYEMRKDTTYHVGYKMILKTGIISSNRTITFYKVIP